MRRGRACQHRQDAPRRCAGTPDRQPPEVYQAIVDEAHKRGLRVAVHMFYLDDSKKVIEAGADILAHSIRDRDVDPAFIAQLKERNIGYIATLTRDYSVFIYETTPAFFKDPFFLKHLDAYRDQMTRLSDPALMEKTRNDKAPRGAQEIKQALEQANRNLRLLVDGGVAVAFGTDTGAQIGRWQGYFEHTELELMVKAGLTPMQALVTAWSGAAKVMKLTRCRHFGAWKAADGRAEYNRRPTSGTCRRSTGVDCRPQTSGREHELTHDHPAGGCGLRRFRGLQPVARWVTRPSQGPTARATSGDRFMKVGAPAAQSESGGSRIAGVIASSAAESRSLWVRQAVGWTSR